MYESSPIRRLRETLVRARQDRDAQLLSEVEDGLRWLSSQGYRCCLLDYERRKPAYYVKLLDYANGRLKAQLEYPINPRLKEIQLLPLSHLADYGEVEGAAPQVERIFRGVAPYIHQKKASLEGLPPGGLLPPPTPQNPARQRRRRREKKVWWYVGGVFLLVVLAHLLAGRLGPYELL